MPKHRLIYDLDDDNIYAPDSFYSGALRPVWQSETQWFAVPDSEEMLALQSPSNVNVSVYNPYPHFGLSNGWPRGFPLEKITHSHRANKHVRLQQQQQPEWRVPIYSAKQECKPVVQQYLANTDPGMQYTVHITRPWLHVYASTVHMFPKHML